MSGVIDGEKDYGNMFYSEIYEWAEYNFDENGKLLMYFMDIDEDGENELLVYPAPEYGFDVHKVQNGSVFFLRGGEGTAGRCHLYRGNGHLYLSSEDFSHLGRQLLTLYRYVDDNGCHVAETVDETAGIEKRFKEEIKE